MLAVTVGSGCGGGVVGGSSVVGTVDGAILEPRSAIVSYFACPISGPTMRSMAVIVVTSAPDACESARNGGIGNVAAPGLILIIASDVPQATDLPPEGAYSADVNGSPNAAYSASFASPSQYVSATGPITLDQVTAAQATGSFDLHFGPHGSLHGAFAASACAVNDPGAVGVTFAVCLR